MPYEQRGAQGAAGVAGRRLHPDVFERTLAKEAAIGHAVECDSSGHDEIAAAGRLMRGPRHPEDALLGDALDAGGQIHMPLLECGLRLPRRTTEQLVEVPARHCQALA